MEYYIATNTVFVKKKKINAIGKPGNSERKSYKTFYNIIPIMSKVYNICL